MIELNKFSLHILGGNSMPGGYVEMKHNSTYKLQLRNGNYRRADAFVTIDGKPVGAWRVPANSTIVLERGVDDLGMFTFFESGTVEASQAELHNVQNSDLGLIQVRFELEQYVKPIIKSPPVYALRKSTRLFDLDTSYGTFSSVTSDSLLCDRSMDNTTTAKHSSTDTSMCCFASSHTAGGTGLTGQSNQYFTNAEELSGYDPEFSTTISIRLIAKKKVIKPIVSHSNTVPQFLRL